MPDDFDIRSGLPPSDALRALPLLSPPRSAWPALQASLDARRPRVPQRWHWLAAAAALALALALPRFLSETPVVPTVVPAANVTRGDESAELARLMAESAQLEALLAWHRNDAVESAAAASLHAAMQDRIVQVDALLMRADVDPEARLPLWQERVLRLRQLAGLSSTEQMLAANGEADSGLPVMAF